MFFVTSVYPYKTNFDHDLMLILPRCIGRSCSPASRAWTHPVSGIQCKNSAVSQAEVYNLVYRHLAEPKVDHCVHQVVKVENSGVVKKQTMDKFKFY